MAAPTPMMNRSQRRQVEQMAKRAGVQSTPQPAARPSETPAETPAEAPPAPPTVDTAPAVAGEIDGVEVDAKGQIIFRSDEEREAFEGLPPKSQQEQIGDLATRLYATEAELAQTKQLLARRNIALVKAIRRAKDMEGQRDTAVAAANALAAPAPEPDPAAD